MKNKNKKRGFTLIELLATITILSVVMIIAIPSVTKLIKKFGDNYYNMLEGNIKLAGMDYFTDHKTEIPKYINESSVISLYDLKTKGYIEEAPKDKNKEEIKEGYVIAYKTNKGEYEYQACIITEDGEYKTTADYCDDSYKLENNIILVPPSNGVYALPQKKPENFDDIIRIYSATNQNKANNSTRNKLISEGTVVTVNPVKAIVSCEGECEGIKGPYEEKENNPLKKQLNSIISKDFEEFKEKNKGTYTSWLKGFLKKKIKIKYIYQYKGKTAEALFSFVEANEGEAPGEIKVVLDEETKNSEQVYGSVNEKEQTWVEKKIPENTENINWYNKKLVATVSPINGNENRITKYYCESKNKPGNIFECSDETINNSIQRILYSEANDIIKIYGVNKYGIPTPNTVTYSVKTDTSVPTTAKINIEGTKGSNEWYKSNIKATAEYTKKHLSGYKMEVSLEKLNINKSVIESETKSSDFNPKTYNFLNITNDSIYKYYIKICTGANNCRDIKPKTIYVDKTNPEIPTSKVNDKPSSGGTYGWTAGNITWNNFSGNDNFSGINHYEYSTNCTGSKSDNLGSSYTYSSNLNWKFCIRSVDNAGNASSWSKDYNFKIDKTTPTFTVTVKKKNNEDNLNGSSNISSLANYPNNTWFNGYTFVKIESLESGPSGATVTCTDSRPNKDTFSTYRNVDTEGTTTISCQATSGTGLKSGIVTKTIKLDRCGSKRYSDSWNSWSSTCNDSNQMTRTGTRYYTSNLSGQSCGSTSINDSKTCDLSLSCDISNIESDCTSASLPSGGGNHIIGRIKVKCNQPIDEAQVWYYYEGGNNKICNGVSASTQVSDSYPTSSWSSAKNGALFNFRGCGSTTLKYKIKIKKGESWTTFESSAGGYKTFDMSIGTSSGTCDPVRGGHWFS